MNSRIVIQKCSDRLGFSYALIEDVYMSYWKDKKEHLQNPEYEEIMLDYIGKFEMTDKRLATTLKYQKKQLEKLSKKIEKDSIVKGEKLTNIYNDLLKKVEILEQLKTKYNF